MTELNVAMIGYRFMGRAHSNAYRQVAPFLEPRITPRRKVICGRSADAVEREAERLGWEEAATDWREVIARDDIDLVDICTPGDTHAEIAIAAARAGKIVFCEKPLANTLAEAESMLEAVRDAGVLHMICHNYRRVPAVLLAKRLIDAGEIGEVRHFRGTYLQEWAATPGTPLLWRFRKEKAGSGALGDIASHSLDLARFLVGEVREVCGDLETFVRERELPGGGGSGEVTVDDAATALVRFEGGAIGTIEATRAALGRKNHNRFEINGSEGSIAFDLERLNELQLYLQSDQGDQRGFRTILVTDSEHHPFVGKWWPPGHIIGYEHTFTHTVYDLLEAAADERPVSPDFEDGVANQRVLDAWERSAASRAWERV